MCKKAIMTLGAKKKSKNRGGLKNRFPSIVREFWKEIGWSQDLWDGSMTADCLHHIKSQSSSDYKAGNHNKSVLNSCPLNNFRNHIGNGKLHHLDIEIGLLKRVFEIIQLNHYTLIKIDQDFISQYDLINKLKSNNETS